MEQRLERLFWLVGGALLLPFILHLGTAFNPGETEHRSSPAQRSAAPVQPAISTGEVSAGEASAGALPVGVAPVGEVSTSGTPAGGRTATQRRTEPAFFQPRAGTNVRPPHDRAGAPVGRLLIPQLDLSVPVFADASQLNLEHGLALLPGSPDLEATNTIGVVSSSDTLWQHLDELPTGARLVLQSEQELRLFFVLENRRLEQSRDWHPASATPPLLTLVYRARDGSKSQVLRAVEARSNTMDTAGDAGAAHRLRRF